MSKCLMSSNQGCGIAKFFRDSESDSDSGVRDSDSDSDSTFKNFAIPIPIPLQNFEVPFSREMALF